MSIDLLKELTKFSSPEPLGVVSPRRELGPKGLSNHNHG